MTWCRALVCLALLSVGSSLGLPAETPPEKPVSAAPSASPPSRSPWSAWTSAHFRAVTDADPRIVHGHMRRLEAMRAAVPSVWPGIRRESALPVFALMFRDAKGFEPFVWQRLDAQFRQAGFFAKLPGIGFIATNLGDENALRTTYHEYFHHLLELSYAAVPLWINEGMAEYFSTFALDGTSVTHGAPIKEHVRWLSLAELIPLRALAKITPDSPAYKDENGLGALYAESWAFVHFVMRSGRGSQLARLLEECAKGKPADEAFLVSFGKSYEEMDPLFRAHVKQGQWLPVGVEIEPQVVKGEIQAGNEDEGRIGALLGWLQVAVGPSASGDRKGRFEKVVANHPKEALAHAGLALLALEEHHLQEARKHVLAALERDAEDHLVNFVAARIRWEEYETEKESLSILRVPESVMQARAHLTKVLQRYPEFVEAVTLMGVTYTARPVDPKSGISWLEQARALQPAGKEILAPLIDLYRRTGQREKADQAMRDLCLVAPEECVGYGDRSPVSLQLEKADQLVEAGRLREAITLLEKTLQEISEPVLHAEIAQQLEQWRSVETNNRCVEEYNKAVSLANAGRARDALDKLNASLLECQIAKEIWREMVSLQRMLNHRTDPR